MGDLLLEQARLPDLIENLPVGICIYRQRGEQVQCAAFNARYAEMFGVGQDEMREKSLEESLKYIHPDDRERCRREIVDRLREKRRTSGLYRFWSRKEDRYGWYRLDGSLVEQPQGEPLEYFTFTDMSETMQTREELELSRQAMNSIVRYAPGGVFVYSAEEDEEFSFVSENMLSMLGYTQEEFRKKFDNRFSRMVYREDREDTLRTIWEQIAAGPFDTCFYRIEKKDGSLIWVHDEGHIVTDEQGKRWFYVVIVDITKAEQDKCTLSSQNDELRRLLDSIPAQVVVYQKTDGVVGIIAGNKFIETKGFANLKTLTGMSGQGLMELVDPRDKEIVDGFFDRLFSGETTSAELTYRTMSEPGGSSRWYSCNAIARPQEDGTVRVYAVYTDATLQKDKEDNFDRVVQELLVVNPNALCAFRLNLTRNLCTDGHGASEYTRQLLEASTADELLQKIGSILTDSREEERFNRDFSRSRLLEAYANGEERLETTYRRRTDSGEDHWVTTYFHILQNPYNDDIEAIAYTVDSDHAHKESRIVSLLTSEEYDCIGLVDSDTRALTYYYVSEACHADGYDTSKDFDERVRFISGRLPSEREKRDYQKAASLSVVYEALENASVYTYAYSIGSRRKQVSFRYLEEDRREIMFAVADVTLSFEHEEAYARQLRRALLDAEKANDMKTDFLGNVSHDMRTPLNAILGYNRLAREAPNVPPEVMEYLRKTDIAGNTLLTLINDTLDLQKIETGAIALKPVPIRCSEVIRQIVTSVQPLMEQKHIDFVIDTSRAVMATINIDVMRVREIFINLLSNAVKFTPEGGRVEMIVECVGLEERCVHDRVIIRDNGIGMSQEFLEKMYEPFTQERTKSTAHIGGSGLGLSIVKRTVELMSGRIEARSELGKGTEFDIYLDFERLDDVPAAENGLETAPAGIRGLRVLLAEDNAMNAEIAGRILEMNGASFVLATDGGEACQIFEDSRPGELDAILMDIRMPVMDGYTAARTIRALPRPDAGTIPILAMSADAYDSDVERSLRSGMNGHIAKPIDPQKLVGELAGLTGTRAREG